MFNLSFGTDLNYEKQPFPHRPFGPFSAHLGSEKIFE